jgi:flagella basal body P-ring formation protein FlgA
MLLALALASITLDIPSDAHVRGQEMHLGDVVRIDGADPADATRLAAISLGYTPSPGFARVLTRDEIAAKVHAAVPGTSFDVTGSDRCRIDLETEVVHGDALRNEAAQALRAALNGRDATITDEGTQADVVVPKASSKIELHAQSDARTLRSGIVPVAVQVWIDGSPYQTVQSSFKVELYDTLPVLVADVRRGDMLGSTSTELRRVRVDASLAGEPLSMSALPGATLTHDMQKGMVVTDRDVQRAQLVKQGDLVQIQVRKGPVVARSTAIASQDGCLGDKVRVTTANSKRELTATITGHDCVEVDLTDVSRTQQAGAREQS